MLTLTEQGQGAIRALAAPLQPLERDIFVAHVAEALAGYPPEARGAWLIGWRPRATRFSENRRRSVEAKARSR